MPTQDIVEKTESSPLRRYRVGQVLKESVITFFKEDSLTDSAAIAYFALLSLFPLLLLLVSLSGLYIRRYELSGELTVVLQSFLPIKPDFIMQKLVEISRAFGPVSLISIVLLLWSSTGMFPPLERALNRAWQVEQRRSWWRSYIVALQMAFLFAFFIAIYSGLVGVNLFFHDKVYRWAELHTAPMLTEFIYHGLFVATTFGMTLIVFTLLFRRLPNRQLSTRKVFPSAFLTAILWELARSLFTHLLPLFNYSHVYGSIGVIVTLMTWLYVSSAVTLFGAHISHNLYKTLETPHQAPVHEPVTQSAGEVRKV
jgi:membrane protein